MSFNLATKNLQSTVARTPLLKNALKQTVRGISSTKTKEWDQIRSQMHPNDNSNPFLEHPSTVSIIGAPMTHGQPLLGTDGGPDMLRAGGLHEMLVDLQWRVEETGNLEFAPPTLNDPVVSSDYGLAKQSYAVGNGLKKLADRVAEKTREGKFSLVLGGDHTIGCGSLAGVLREHPDAGCIWVDAHADINTPQLSPSGNIHGMPLSFLMKGLVDNSKIPGFEWLVDGPSMVPEQLVYVGLRDVDQGEREIIKRLGIKAFTMQDVDKYGIGKVMEMGLDHLCKTKQRPLHMSYDIDAVDPAVAPSTGTTVRGGLTWREAHYVAEAVAESNLLCSLDLVEVNPSLVPGKGADNTVDMGLLLISSALGNRII